MDWDTYAEQYRQVEFKAGIPPLLDRVLSTGSGRLLDMGCGEGALLDRLRDRYGSTWQLVGFEVSRVRAEMARARDHDVIVSRDGSVPAGSGLFDVVVSSHVIEHVPDDLTYASQLAELVRPGGYVYLETPLRLPGGWYFRRNPKAGWVLDPTHLREYRSSAEATSKLTNVGLVVQAERITPIAFPLASAEALARRIAHLPQRSGPPRGLRAKAVPIPRYREIAVLARRPDTSSPEAES